MQKLILSNCQFDKLGDMLWLNAQNVMRKTQSPQRNGIMQFFMLVNLIAQTARQCLETTLNRESMFLL